MAIQKESIITIGHQPQSGSRTICQNARIPVSASNVIAAYLAICPYERGEEGSAISALESLPFGYRAKIQSLLTYIRDQLIAMPLTSADA